ncbi:hypothetical protein [Corynebacterium sp. A21]|uniref:hypothetical protein n=1 Tax=Corynebacterium sp. A21 TaxID=3457318 RepID=UPI003FD16B91
MRALYLGLAAVFCVAALAINFLDVPRGFAILALVVAGIFLVLGLRVTAENQPPAVIRLDEEQSGQVRSMLAEGRDGAAISQVQLWFRNTTPEQARAAVEKLRSRH